MSTRTARHGRLHALRERFASLRDSAWWPWLKRAGVFAFFALVAWLLIEQARDIEWSKVAESMKSRPLPMLLLAAGLALLSHLIYSTFDLFGRRVTGHDLPTRRVMMTASTSYIFNLNLGALIGGMAFRYRLYSRQGLKPGTIATVVATSMLTNWIGYLLLAGVVLLAFPPELPADWPIAGASMRLAGIVMIAGAAAWQLACLWSKRREWNVFGHPIRLPSARLAALQILLSAANWAVMGGVVMVLLGGDVAYPLVLGTLLVAAVAGVLAHVPAGLGVLEAVFVALLGSQMAHSEVIGALLLYRAIYYLAPLVVAVLMQWRLESTAGDDGAEQPANASTRQSTEVSAPVSS
ncbi:lysylphosphatidylglycerol synthase domain-containing protein [Piscinibacter sakaiensis]|uniref:lysylphosphatidylglycerol synthase domain-containing protein n=1 Tax=Piscinibacter sakaiensis TaxID=1547922 RepID=UPI003AB0AC6D